MADNVDLRELHEPNSKFIFITIGGLPKPFDILRIERNAILVPKKNNIPQSQILDCRLIASHHGGVIHLKCRASNAEVKDDLFDIIPLEVVPGSIEIINKRELRRLDLQPPIPAVLAMDDGTRIAAMICDISAGGVCLDTKTELKINVIYTITSDTLKLEDEALSASIVVLHDKPFANRDPKSNIRRYGAKFVLPSDESPKSRQGNDLESKLIRFINKELVDRKKRMQSV